ncbi:MAG: alpha/beta hydrolase-fold protein [Gemmataceae bacterium]
MKWIACVAVLTACLSINNGLAQRPSPTGKKRNLQELLDNYIDGRLLEKEQRDKTTTNVLKVLKEENVGPTELEKLLRGSRASYAKPARLGSLRMKQPLKCDHVDYSTEYFLYVPKTYDPGKASPLLIVGHGGNSNMPLWYARRASLGGLQPWIKTAEKEGIILAAPLTERGWGPIGNSVVLSLTSKMKRRYNIDPNRIYITGHSMGGHLSWRSAITMPDRWAAVSPMSGGYDYVENKQVYNLVNVPGYATYGKREPYQINTFNNKIKTWMAERKFDWQLVERQGGHEIFADEIPKIAQFFLERPRNLYRPMVYARLGGKLVFDSPWKIHQKKHTWRPGRGIPFSMIHWLRLEPLPEDTPKEKRIQKVLAKYEGKNKFVIVAQNAKKLKIYLHPKMVDFNKPIQVEVNGRLAFHQKVAPDRQTMLELVREFDDRGRIFHAAIEVQVTDSRNVPEPQGVTPKAKRAS